jgi:predicted P-loop ATPase
MINLNEIKHFHKMGFSMWYLHPKQKRPIGDNWTSLPNKTLDDLKGEFKEQNNIGVRLGEASKIKGRGYLACIDVDVKDPEYKTEAIKKLGELTAGKGNFPVVYSGSGNGSRHVYCVTKKPFKQITVAKHKDKWEIVIYSTGRQMVLPPSIHPDTGRAYKWASDAVFDAKDLPLFDISEIEVEAKNNIAEITLDFKAEDVNLYDSNLPLKLIKLIETGKGSNDRSADLFTIALAMCRARFSDNQILSVLSDPDHWISSAAYDHTQSNSRLRAVKWLHKYTLTKARHETSAARRFANKPLELRVIKKSEQIKDEADLKELADRAMPDVDKSGKPKSTLKNVIHVLEVFMDGALIGYNEFSNRTVFLKDTLYGGVKGKELTDDADLDLKVYLAEHYRFEPSKDLCFEAHNWIAKKNAFNPVKSYLEGITWDGVERLDTWLKTAFKAVGPRDYLAAIGRKTLAAAVSRIYQPGCKFDHVLVLEGYQGKGKSTALRMLASDSWFTDGLGDIHQKDVVDQMAGKWIIEIAELATFKGKDADLLKSFITRQVDRVRMPYGRRSGDFPRQSIFIGSTNNNEYLHDETGNRRFWPVAIEQADFKWLKQHRDQLWAEALALYKTGETLYLDEEHEKIAKKEQSKRFVTDEWELMVKDMLNEESIDRFTTTEIWRKVTTNVIGHPNDIETKRIGKIMRRLGFARHNLRINGVQGKVWVRHA